MHKIFIDTDVILDVLIEREKFKEDARKIFQKFEDNLQLFPAIEMGLDFLITRKVKDFPKTDHIKILTPKELLGMLVMEEKKP